MTEPILAGKESAQELESSPSNVSRTSDDKVAEENELDASDHGDFSEKHDGTAQAIDSSTRTSSSLSQAHGCCARLKRGEGCCGRCLFRWPRSSACCCGVVIPLFLLIFVSFVFGYFLSRLEAPNEIETNNDILAAQALNKAALNITLSFATSIPRICYELYLESRPTDDLLSAASQILEERDITTEEFLQNPLVQEFLSGSLILINTTSLYEFMRDCGEEARPLLGRFSSLLQNTSDIAEEDLSFNWIRCVPGATGIYSTSNIFKRPPLEEMQYSSQLQQFEEEWTADQEMLYAEHLQALLAKNYTPAEAKTMAFEMSIAEANGGNTCYLNGPAAVWFWFTVMTTVGYGNQAPETRGGRGMVYTLGFVSILAFGGILAVAGYIVSATADDAAGRARLNILTRPWVACTAWGILYYSWMLLIGAYTLDWKRERLGLTNEEFDYGDAYWFSYISTTTVGLGDYYLESEVIIGIDLLVFPLLFLVGFTYLSSFLGKLTEVIYNRVRRNRSSLMENLLAQFKTTNVLPNVHDLQELVPCLGHPQESAEEQGPSEQPEGGNDS